MMQIKSGKFQNEMTVRNGNVIVKKPEFEKFATNPPLQFLITVKRASDNEKFPII